MTLKYMLTERSLTFCNYITKEYILYDSIYICDILDKANLNYVIIVKWEYLELLEKDIRLCIRWYCGNVNFAGCHNDIVLMLFKKGVYVCV